MSMFTDKIRNKVQSSIESTLASNISDSIDKQINEITGKMVAKKLSEFDKKLQESTAPWLQVNKLVPWNLEDLDYNDAGIYLLPKNLHFYKASAPKNYARYVDIWPELLAMPELDYRKLTKRRVWISGVVCREINKWGREHDYPTRKARSGNCNFCYYHHKAVKAVYAMIRKGDLLEDYRPDHMMKRKNSKKVA